ncbi:hypothetical protein MRX96_019471 [Rhipicephalus microplus]
MSGAPLLLLLMRQHATPQPQSLQTEETTFRLKQHGASHERRHQRYNSEGRHHGPLAVAERKVTGEEEKRGAAATVAGPSRAPIEPSGAVMRPPRTPPPIQRPPVAVVSKSRSYHECNKLIEPVQ